MNGQKKRQTMKHPLNDLTHVLHRPVELELANRHELSLSGLSALRGACKNFLEITYHGWYRIFDA